MKPAIQEIFQYVLDHPEMTTIAAVDSFFGQFLWSIEKQEWNSLTPLYNKTWILQQTDR